GMALFGGAAFVSSAPSARTGHLRATAPASAAPVTAQSSGLEANVACMAVAGAAVASCLSRKAGSSGSSGSRQLVALTAFENELGVQAPVGFWDPAGFTADGSTENFARRRQTELKHGRISMLDGLTGSAWGDWANYTASPLRAFENELGVQAPVGFWDPAGFTADGSTENFARRRQTELKHGRISMLATMGYITPEITGKLPGYLSPS
ncbi:unnamed protein product, partial [Effrenium voratum]